MRPLTKDQVARLVESVVTAQPDSLDCDGCFGRLAEFAEAQLADNEVPDALAAIETHLRQCPCCREEYEALLDGLRSLDTR